jgi:hypothetical protein
MNAQNTETVARVVRVVRGIGARTPDERQAALLAQDGGASVFEGLAASRRGGREPINAPAFRAIDSLDLVPGDGVAEI